MGRKPENINGSLAIIEIWRCSIERFGSSFSLKTGNVILLFDLFNLLNRIYSFFKLFFALFLLSNIFQFKFECKFLYSFYMYKIFNSSRNGLIGKIDYSQNKFTLLFHHIIRQPAWKGVHTVP